MIKKIRAVIIDDEEPARKTLHTLVSEYCTDVEVIGMAKSVATGIKLIKTTNPELVFLDIDMVDGYGFDVLKETDYSKYGVVFTTAYSTYAAKAFEFAALHYILKPIEIAALVDSVERYKLRNRFANSTQLEVLEDTLLQRVKKLNIHIEDNIIVFDIDKIYYFSSDDGNTFIHINNDNTHLVPNSLTYYENLLLENGFFRIHAKYLVNLRNVHRVVSLGRNGTVRLNNDNSLPISTRKKPEFLKKLKDWNQSN